MHIKYTQCCTYVFIINRRVRALVANPLLATLSRQPPRHNANADVRQSQCQCHCQRLAPAERVRGAHAKENEKIQNRNAKYTVRLNNPLHGEPTAMPTLGQRGTTDEARSTS
ncbi:maker175 [Drosophila busckii]|uniref:Maker175 n=1 Tax=Drosophila busckii TaxID=30019 RepID=A0A0M4EKU5_DROBS|nr:maker175 [Drosophila busckii]